MDKPDNQLNAMVLDFINQKNEHIITRVLESLTIFRAPCDNLNALIKRSDSEALASDWLQVGIDLGMAIETYKEKICCDEHRKRVEDALKKVLINRAVDKKIDRS